MAYGTALGGAQLNAYANVWGNMSYSPSFGTVLSAGIHVLTATFVPWDPVQYSTTSTTVSILVTQGTPLVNWAAPAPIVAGTSLSGAQLDATANIPGSFSYSPGLGAIPGVGVTMLQAVFTPADNVDYATATISVPLVVTGASVPPPVPTPGPIIPPTTNIAILSPSPGDTVSGTIYVQGFVNLYLDAAGTFLMVDGQEVGTRRVGGAPWIYPLDTTTLSNGPHVLQLWGHDISNNTTISAPVTVTILN